MEFLKDRRLLLILAGALGAIALGVGGAFLLRTGHQSAEPPPASQGGLVVETGRADDPVANPSRPIRCFVAGRFVGEMALADCARRNGVATGALDLGIDPSGAVAGGNIAPPPEAPPLPVVEEPAVDTPPPEAAPPQETPPSGASPEPAT